MSVTIETFPDVPRLYAVDERHRTDDHPIAGALLDEFVRRGRVFVHVVQRERCDNPPEEERRALHEFVARTEPAASSQTSLRTLFLFIPATRFLATSVRRVVLLFV